MAQKSYLIQKLFREYNLRMKIYERILRKSFNINTIALITSLVTVIFLMVQIRLMSRQTQVFINQAKNSSWPRLSVTMHRGFTSDGLVKFLKLNIANKGVGPGIIEDINFAYKGLEFNTWWDFYGIIKVPDSITRGHRDAGIYKGFVLSPNETFNMVDWSGNKELSSFIHERIDDVKLKIKFKSIYDDVWILEKEYSSDLYSSDFDLITKVQ